MGTKKFLVHWRFGNEICIKSDKGSPLLGFEVSWFQVPWFQVPTFRSKFSQSSSGRYLVLTLWSFFSLLHLFSLISHHSCLFLCSFLYVSLSSSVLSCPQLSRFTSLLIFFSTFLSHNSLIYLRLFSFSCSLPSLTLVCTK